VNAPGAVVSFWSWQLGAALALNFAIAAVQVAAYASRLAGVRTGRVGTSISLFNLFVTASRFANMFYAPMLGSIADAAGRIVTRQPELVPLEVSEFAWQMRAIVVAGTLGTLAGALLLPTFSHLFVRGVGAFERRGSIPRALARLGDPRVIGDALRTLRLPPLDFHVRFSLAHVPPKLLIGNLVVTAIYAIGVVASYLASVLHPDVARTALSASGLVNGIATVSFALIVDPTSAFMVDQAVKGERTLEEIKSMVFYLALSAVIGTIASQLLLYPAAVFIAGAARLVNGHP